MCISEAERETKGRNQGVLGGCNSEIMGDVEQSQRKFKV